MGTERDNFTDTPKSWICHYASKRSEGFKECAEYGNFLMEGDFKVDKEGCAENDRCTHFELDDKNGNEISTKCVQDLTKLEEMPEEMKTYKCHLLGKCDSWDHAMFPDPYLNETLSAINAKDRRENGCFNGWWCPNLSDTVVGLGMIGLVAVFGWGYVGYRLGWFDCCLARRCCRAAEETDTDPQDSK